MEYEQLENGNKVLHQCILSQDVGSFYELLHPDAKLITHFPYPDSHTGAETPALAALSPALTVVRAEALGKRTAKQRKAQLLRDQAAIRAAQEQRYQAHLQARLDAAGNGSHPQRAAGGSLTSPPAAAEASPSADAAAGGDGGAKKRKAQTPAAPPPALEGRREHRGLTFYFRQPPPIPSMVMGSASAPEDPWGGPSAGAPATAKAGATGVSSTAPADTATATAAAAVSAGDGGGGAAQLSGGVKGKDASGLDAAVAAEYGNYVDVTEGRLLICERFCLLLRWMNEDQYVANVEALLEPRKSVLQDAEVLPAPPSPRTPQEAYAQLGRMYTERNQLLSRLTVTWGRERLMFCDQLFFDDGQVVCIHRRLLTLPEMLSRFPTNGQQWSQSQKIDKIREELKDFYGVTKSRVAAVSHGIPMLDFSFVEVGSDVMRLLAADTTPAAGRRHVCRPERPQADPRLAQGVFLNADNDPTNGGQSNRTLIKAKNKRGEEEAYEFTDAGHQRYQVFGGGDDDGTGVGGAGDGFPDDVFGGTQGSSSKDGNTNGGVNTANRAANSGGGGGPAAAMRRRFKFDATSLRISGCQLSIPTAATAGPMGGSSRGTHNGRGPGGSGNGSAAKRVPPFASVIRGLVANAMLTLHFIDLSDNHLSELPDLSMLPLQKLLLHGNDISDWTEVEEKVCTLPYLTSVTLYGNPIADNDAKYWVQALSRLLRSTHRRVKLKQLDFVTLTAQDLNLMGVRQ